MKKELNFELLKSLYKVFSPSMNEKRMRKFIKRYVSNNIDGVSIVQDKAGNLYLTRGESESYPCICAHMDQVQHIHPKDFECIENDDVIFGYSKKIRKQCGLGADDKNGLFIALECLASYDVMKCAFFVGEEIGCVGSRNADMEFFADCRFCIQADRRGNSDMVTEIYQKMCSDEFIADVTPEEYGYSLSNGAMTDVAELSENGIGVSCINLSCGYYEPHTDHEFASKSDILKCYDFVCHIIEDCRKAYPFVGIFNKVDNYGWWSGFTKKDNSCTSDYINTIVKNDIANTISWDPDATFEEVLDELTYNGLSQYISVEKAYAFYEEAKSMVKKEA